MAAHDSLGNDGFLAKIDRLRATNVGSMIPLPQVIVVGDQSSGKSSALESLTGFAFPRAATLCTRYATQISCTRAPDKKISVSIIPRPDASGELEARLQAFRRDVSELDAAELARIFQEANTAMGIRMEEDDICNKTSSAFSEDILRIDIQGPEEVHLTLIDVPGIFRIPTPGLTTDSDIALVRNMVKRYMSNTRTIILAVIPCNVDIASQEILKLAAAADPKGVRTMGVLTKPDLLQEAATKKPVLELVEGRRNPLKLGYCVIANRGADDHTSTEAERLAAEQALFQAPPWATCVNKAAFGTDSLRKRLRALLLDISQRELPNVRAEITAMKRACSEKLMALGTPRADDSSQRQYLVQLASQMQAISASAVGGYYSTSNGLFEKRKDLRLITRIIQLNELFADTFWKKGHLQNFRKKWSLDGEALLTRTEMPALKKKKEADGPAGEKAADKGSAGPDDSDEDASDESQLERDESEPDERDESEPDERDINAASASSAVYDELANIVVPSYQCPEPKRGPLKPLIQEMYFASRGPELGTFNGTFLASVFRKVSTKWERLVLDHVSKAIVIVHYYIYETLTELCPDQTLRDQIWDMVLRDSVCERYQKAMDHTRSILEIERTGLPVTLNHYFNSTLQKARHERLVASLEKHAKVVSFYSNKEYRLLTSPDKHVPLQTIKEFSTDMDNSEHICDDILDTVESYYKVARKRFVDTVCLHVVYHMLLVGPDSPLAVLSPGNVLKLSKEQLAAIAGEDAVTISQRETLQRQIESLEEAVKILRS